MIELLPAREVALQIGSWQIRWYGVMYVLAFCLAWMLLPRLQKYRQLHLTKDLRLEVLTAGVIGVVAGGRLGYVVFYQPMYFLAHPLQIFAMWQGGMSSHGGFIGVGLALWWVARRLRIDIWALADVAVVPIAFGLALGRVGNFINQELFVSTLGYVLAIGKDLVIALICWAKLDTSPYEGEVGRRPGEVVAVFLILYSLLRFFSEYLRIQDYPPVLGLTRGQLFTLPIILVGGLLYRYVHHNKS